MTAAAFFVAAAFGFWGIPRIIRPTYARSSPVVPSAGPAPTQTAQVPEPKTKTADPPPVQKSAAVPLAVEAGAVDSAPEVIRKVDPEYTQSARNAHASGSVRLAFFVNPRGFPQQIRVIRGLGYGLNRKAIDALSHWHFRPAMKDGKPVLTETEAEVQFQESSAR